jgi:hypothetical protein
MWQYLGATKTRQKGPSFSMASDQRPRWPSAPDWIAYSDAPPMVADRALYELLLASCREDWEKTGDPQTVATACCWVFMHRQLLPAWLNEAVGAASAQRRGKRHAQQYEIDAQHRIRWWWVKRTHDNGASWERAYKEAADTLRETAASGSPETMKKSYARFQQTLRANPARKALILGD